jgi:DNA-binding PadR family transcriptional regulator
MERELLLLGLLSQNEMYGYQINEMIKTHVSASIRLTKPTAYRLLHSMADDGWVTFREEKEGNRPTRRVFSITNQGTGKFQELLKHSLANYVEIENPSVIGLAFLGGLRRREATSLLETRLETLRAMLDEKIGGATEAQDYSLLVENQILHLSAEIEWLIGVIAEV